jgi:hypothetical protein
VDAMKKIYKYTMEADDTATPFVTMPIDAVVLTTGVQDGNFVAWAEVNPDEKILQIYHFCIVHTGGSIPNSSVYINTILDRQFVWHVYQRW